MASRERERARDEGREERLRRRSIPTVAHRSGTLAGYVLKRKRIFSQSGTRVKYERRRRAINKQALPIVYMELLLEGPRLH